MPRPRPSSTGASRRLHLDPVRGAGRRCARRPAGRVAAGRGARAAGARTARARARASPLPHELPLRPPRGAGGARARRSCAPGSSSACSRTGSAPPSATRRTTICCSRELRARSTVRRPSPGAGHRSARLVRATAETRVRVRLALDGASRVRVATGAGLYDHFLEQLAFHAGFDLVLEAAGDLETGEHHTAEDAAIALGEALDRALGDRRGIARYGDAVVPMDDALARAAVDLGGRPAAELRLELDPGLADHVLRSLCAGRPPRPPRRSRRPRCAPRRRGGVQGRRTRAARGRARRGRRGPVDERVAVRVAVCEYGAGNVRSVVLACERARRRRRARPSDPEEVARADLAVLPGVGSARSAMQGLAARGLDDALRERVSAGRADARDLPGPPAGPRVVGRRRWRPWTCPPAGTRRTAPTGRVPRIGWARVDPGGEEFYFAHSFAAETPAATASSEGVVAVAQSGGFVGVQFHPEKSGARRRPLPGAMPLPRLIPCLDVAGDRVVKGVRFEGLREVGDPVELGTAYSDAGADELVFLDVGATVERRETLLGLVRQVAERLSIPFTVGGGIRTVGDADALLEAGADKVAVNTAALARPELLTGLAEKLGSQAVVLAIDATGRRRPLARGRGRDRPLGGRVGPRGRGTRRRRDSPHLDRRRRDAERLRPRADGGGRRRGLGTGDRVGRRRHCRTRRGCPGRRAGCAARLDPPRESGTPGDAQRRASRSGSAASRCRLSSAQRSSNTRTRAACSCSPGWTTRRCGSPARAGRRTSTAAPAGGSGGKARPRATR